MSMNRSMLETLILLPNAWILAGLGTKKYCGKKKFRIPAVWHSYRLGLASGRFRLGLLVIDGRSVTCLPYVEPECRENQGHLRAIDSSGLIRP